MSLEEVHFLRHGETDMNRQLRCQGRIDIPLNEEGERQAAAAAESFKDIQLHSVYSSPLTRAVQSAEAVAKVAGIEVGILEWLSEIDHGAVEGMNREEADAKYPGLLDTWLNEPQRAEFPGGETVDELAKRVRDGLRELLRKENGPVLLVTHQVVSGAARCILKGLPLSRVWENKLVNGDSFHFRITPEERDRILKE